MTAISNVNYYYRQAVESNHVKTIITSISAIAFYLFQGIKVVAFVSIVSVIPLSVRLASTFGQILILIRISQIANQGLERWQRRISNETPSYFLQQVIHRVESIIVFILKQSLTFSTIIFLPPLIVIGTALNIPLLITDKVGDYIEDISTKISQKAIDTLGIPVQLSISPGQLKSILKEWENQALPGENRRDASKNIISFYENSRRIIPSFPIICLEDCQLHALPDIFHYKPFSNISSFSLKNNQLTTLPESISALQKLNDLNLEENALSRLPDVLYRLPRSCTVFVNSNRFSEEEVGRIRTITNHDNYAGPVITDMPNPSNCSIDNLYSTLYRSIDRVPGDLSNLEGTKTLQSWLLRLIELPNSRMINENIINFLEEANRNETFRTIFTGIIQEASQTCGDRVSLSILHLDIAYQLVKIDRTDMKKLATFLLKGCWAMDLLEECARAKVNSMRAAGKVVDEIEVYLGYPIKLKQELELPISQNSMIHFSLSNLTSDNLDTAKEYVKARLNNKDEALDQLIKYDEWKEALIHNKGGKIALIEREKEQASNAESPDYEAIQNRYTQALKDLSRQILDW